jgi:hypothetical protein
MVKAENIADLVMLYPQISKGGQDNLTKMAQTMLSIQNSDDSQVPDHNNKENFVTQIFPKISRQGQEYLEKISHVMLLIQSSTISPIHNSG